MNILLVTSAALSFILGTLKSEELLEHQSVAFYSYQSEERFEETLLELKSEYPEIRFSYFELEKGGDKKCFTNSASISIVIPAELNYEPNIKYKLTFQSHLKNCFGELTFEIQNDDNNKVILKDEQLFYTTIGK